MTNSKSVPTDLELIRAALAWLMNNMEWTHLTAAEIRALHVTLAITSPNDSQARQRAQFETEYARNRASQQGVDVSLEPYLKG